MNLYLLDANWAVVLVLDIFTSFLWVDKYWEDGHLEINTVPSPVLLEALKTAVYISMDYSVHVMVIEHTEIDRVPEEHSATMVIKCRSLESILDRRIVWERTYMDGYIWELLDLLIDENIVSPTDTDRQIADFTFMTSSDPNVTGQVVNTQFLGETLLEVVIQLCKSREIGFMILPDFAGGLNMYLYAGVNRAYNQTENPYVTFSPYFDNLKNIKYIQTNRFKKTIMLVRGEEVEGVNKVTTVEAPGGGKTGLDRRETYFEPSSEINPNGTEVDYILQLQGRGREELANLTDIFIFDGEADVSMYKYALTGGDFYMGDVVQTVDEFGNERQARITEMIYSYDSTGFAMFPAFTTKSNAHMLNGQSVKSAPIVLSNPTVG